MKTQPLKLYSSDSVVKAGLGIITTSITMELKRMWTWVYTTVPCKSICFFFSFHSNKKYIVCPMSGNTDTHIFTIIDGVVNFGFFNRCNDDVMTTESFRPG